MNAIPPRLRAAAALLACGAPVLSQSAAATVFGEVRDPDGLAATATRVVAEATTPWPVPPSLRGVVPSRSEVVSETTTDERGRFALALPIARTVAIRAVRGDLRSETVAPVPPGASVVLRLHRSVTRSGSLRLDTAPGAPAAEGASARTRVELRLERAPRGTAGFAPDPYVRLPTRPSTEPWASTEVGRDGAFEIAAPEGAAVELFCPSLGLRGDAAAEGDLSMAATLRPLGGTVVSRTGPIEGALLRWRGGPAGWLRETGADGTFACLAPGDPYVTCVAPGFQPELFLASQGELKLRPGAPRTTVVTDADGRPLGGARCWIVHWTNGPVASGPVAVEAVADEAGAVTFYGGYPVTAFVATGSGLVRAFHAGADATPERVALATHALRGTVVGPDRAPRPHAPIWLVRRDAPEAEWVYDGRDPAAHADHGGRFVLPELTDGPYWIATAEPSLPPTTVAVDVTGEDGTVELRQREGPCIEGRVVDPQGQPVAGALVGIVCRPADPALAAFDFGDRHAWTAADGTFRLACIDDAAHTITVRRAGARDAAAHVRAHPGDDAVELVLAR